MFKLSGLVSYSDIVIQCHDNPDADALGSAFALYTYLLQNGKKPRMIYSGFDFIKKSNLRLMVETLKIPVEHIKEPISPELLVCVDCQYGQGNVYKFEAGSVAVIDHHLKVTDDFGHGIIESNLGSCSTLVWKLLSEEDFDFAANPNVSTALYYGLFSDTNSFTEINHPLDKDMRDYLSPFCDMAVISRLRNCNLSFEELEIAGVALLRNYNDFNKRYALFKAEDCDPNILGFISDIALQVDTVDICVVYSQRGNGAKLSVRSCSREVMASEYAEYLTNGVGSGGGHRDKAGGFIQKAAIDLMGISITDYMNRKTAEYFDSYDVINASNHNIDTANMKRYIKKPIPKGFAVSADVFENGTPVMIRTLEGDINIKASPDIYLMVGIEGEVYPIKAEKFTAYYSIMDEVFNEEYKYPPKAKNEVTGEVKELAPYLKHCVCLSEAPIFAAPLTRNTKVFTEWNTNGYMYGETGDFLAIKCDDLNDVYIIQDYIFEKTYESFRE